MARGGEPWRPRRRRSPGASSVRSRADEDRLRPSGWPPPRRRVSASACEPYEPPRGGEGQATRANHGIPGDAPSREARAQPRRRQERPAAPPTACPRRSDPGFTGLPLRKGAAGSPVFRGHVIFEPVAHAVHRLNVLGMLRVVADLLPEPPDVDVQGPGAAGELVAPHLFQQGVAGDQAGPAGPSTARGDRIPWASARSPAHRPGAAGACGPGESSPALRLSAPSW